MTRYARHQKRLIVIQSIYHSMQHFIIGIERIWAKELSFNQAFCNSNKQNQCFLIILTYSHFAETELIFIDLYFFVNFIRESSEKWFRFQPSRRAIHIRFSGIFQFVFHSCLVPNDPTTCHETGRRRPKTPNAFALLFLLLIIEI